VSWVSWFASVSKETLLVVRLCSTLSLFLTENSHRNYTIESSQWYLCIGQMISFFFFFNYLFFYSYSYLVFRCLFSLSLFFIFVFILCCQCFIFFSSLSTSFYFLLFFLLILLSSFFFYLPSSVLLFLLLSSYFLFILFSSSSPSRPLQPLPVHRWNIAASSTFLAPVISHRNPRLKKLSFVLYVTADIWNTRSQNLETHEHKWYFIYTFLSEMCFSSFISIRCSFTDLLITRLDYIREETLNN